MGLETSNKNILVYIFFNIIVKTGIFSHRNCRSSPSTVLLSNVALQNTMRIPTQRAATSNPAVSLISSPIMQ